ncbi:hypothetical protein [Cupriavidus pinatubonensis]|uniref:Transmembrane protein n=1 Tax=Cupriavidus pinatubonensis TaxID=248026 RepID=A0ABM8Y4E6_9BURK|nr:hypothetical protein [Cupriavidus pinatubonensis]CAG9187656.1 hypothetical protein LMG23994_07101 [Cupriavidus pinatubonensis]
MSTRSRFQLSSFLRFSTDIRTSSRARLQDADQRIDAARERIGRIKQQPGQVEPVACHAPTTAPRPALACSARGIAMAAWVVLVLAVAAFAAEQVLKLQLSLPVSAAVGLAFVVATLLSMSVTYRVERANARLVDTYALQAKGFAAAAGRLVAHADRPADATQQHSQTIEDPRAAPSDPAKASPSASHQTARTLP